MYSKIVGSTFPREGQTRKGSEIIPELNAGQKLSLRREPNNKFDKNAVAVDIGKEQLGYIPAETAIQLAQWMDDGMEFNCFVSEVTGGGDKHYGCNIEIKDKNDSIGNAPEEPVQKSDAFNEM